MDNIEPSQNIIPSHGMRKQNKLLHKKDIILSSLCMMSINILDVNFQKGLASHFYPFHLAPGSLNLLEDFSMYSWEFGKKRNLVSMLGDLR